LRSAATSPGVFFVVIELIDLIGLFSMLWVGTANSRRCAEFVLATTWSCVEFLTRASAVEVSLLAEYSGWVDGVNGVHVLLQGVISVESIDSL
jgi:hypothetical protein